MKKRVFFVIFIFFGLAFFVAFQLQRSPGIYGGLWGDEVCNNNAYLSSGSSLRELSKHVCYFYKPVADFAIKKWFWFKLFAPSEVGFSLVPWFYAGLSLLLVLFVPWTERVEIRFLGLMLLGFCGLELQYSVEAQCYSFSSLLPWIMLFGFGWGLRCLDQKRLPAAFGSLLASTAVGLNSHFFAWPFVFASAGIFIWFFYRAVPTGMKIFWLWRLATGLAFVVGTTIMINIYPIYSLVFSAGASGGSGIKWRQAWDNLMAHWAWITVPLWCYFSIAGAGLFHPERKKRILAWMSAIATGPALYVTMLAASRSYLPTQNRYLIAYIAPTLFTFLLGWDSAAAWASSVRPWIGRAASVLGTALVLVSLRPNLKQLYADVNTGWSQIGSITPMNFSPRFHFFEKAKSYQRPMLVLANQCWLLPVPELYTRYMGSAYASIESEILNVAGCETPPSKLIAGIRSFFANHKEDGIVIIFFEENGQTPLPCRDSLPVLHDMHDYPAGCTAVYEANVIESWVFKHYVPLEPPPAEPEKSEPFLRRIMKKTLADAFFYGGPLMLLGIFVWVWKKGWREKRDQ